MGKQGPCYHCGVTSTPLWRNGPPEKPILCNACGSRWRTKGTLVNYTPLHARSEPDEFEDRRVSKVKAISIKNKEAKLLKRKDYYENVANGNSFSILCGSTGGGSGGGSGGGVFTSGHHNQSLRKGFDEDTSNRSSSGSAISNSDSCMQISSADASDLTGPSQSSMVWDRDTNNNNNNNNNTMGGVPSRKRTCFNRPKQSSVEKLTRDLHTILHEQQSYFSGSSEDDLIFESDTHTPMGSVEFGHGSVLIRHPNSAAREEESEASSLSFDTKNEAYSWLTKKSKMPMDQHHYKRDDDEKLPMAANHNPPLCKIDLKDIINYDVFASHMTNDEKQKLVKYLPPMETSQLPNSLKSMFDSPQFVENLFSFQKLLAQGTFDLSNDQFHSFQGLKSATKASYEHKEVVDNNDAIGFSPRSLFALPPDNSNLMLDYLKYADENENCDQDLLLDVKSNTSFPQAELLTASSFCNTN